MAENVLTKALWKIYYSRLLDAEVAELVDALGSGSSEGFLVGVQISPSAPIVSHEDIANFSSVFIVYKNNCIMPPIVLM